MSNDTIYTETAEQAYYLRQLQEVSETVVREAQNAARKLQDLVKQVERGDGFPLDFSTSSTDKYREALAKREALIGMARMMGVEDDAAVAAASGRDMWFTKRHES